jgi:UDP-GlcNAc:undecaprenyl-phosphate GlcNAc-1-phosphate transferase
VIFLIFNIVFSSLIGLSLVKFSKRIEPSDRCSHQIPTATSGGLIFVLMFFINYTYAYYLDKFYIHPQILCAFFFLAVIGLIDDYYYLSYKVRFIFQFIVAFLVIQGGLIVELPFFHPHYLFGLDYFLTVVLIVGLINASNFFDGLNGLLSGCVLGLLVFSYFFISTDQKQFIELLFIPLFVFYLFNFPKAKIFMGDVGSTFIGLFLSVLALQNQKNYILESQTALIHKGLIFTLAPMMFCWFDVGVTLLRRLIENRHIFQPWRDYFFHHLFEIGYSHVKISFIYYISVLLLCILIFSCMFLKVPFFISMIVYLILQSLFMIWIIKKYRKKYLIEFDQIYINENDIIRDKST